MDFNNSNVSTVGTISTIVLWIWSRLFFQLGAVTIGNIASACTILSAIIASIAAAPLAWKVIKRTFKIK